MYLIAPVASGWAPFKGSAAINAFMLAALAWLLCHPSASLLFIPLILLLPTGIFALH